MSATLEQMAKQLSDAHKADQAAAKAEESAKALVGQLSDADKAALLAALGGTGSPPVTEPAPEPQPEAKNEPEPQPENKQPEPPPDPPKASSKQPLGSTGSTGLNDQVILGMNSKEILEKWTDGTIPTLMRQ